MHRFKDLKVWQKSRKLTVLVYQLTKTFPSDEMFGITSQMRRAALSIVSNIAEGCGRKTDPQLKQFLRIANGSATELEAQNIIASDLGYLSDNDFQLVIK